MPVTLPSNSDFLGVLQCCICRFRADLKIRDYVPSNGKRLHGKQAMQPQAAELA